MQRPDEPIEVVGAGPAGLAVAITVACGGRRDVTGDTWAFMGWL